MREKILVIGSVSAITAVLAVGAFILGMKVMEKKQSSGQSTAEIVHEESSADTESDSTTAPAATGSTTVTTVLTTAKESTTVTTVTTAPKPTITNSYLYYINTGIGCKLYLHVDGDYADYEYEVYLGSDKTDDGINSKQEFLVAEGLGGGGISTYKALVTAWNSDHSQSVEQWAYINENLSDDGKVHPPKKPVYLFGGNPANVKNSISLRRKPNAQSAVITEIPVGAQIGIYSCDVSGWYWAEYGDYKGYVNAKYVTEIEAHDPFEGGGRIYLSIGYSDAPLRDYPSDAGSVYTLIPSGSQVLVSGIEGDWYIVDYEGATGYVHKSDMAW